MRAIHSRHSLRRDTVETLRSSTTFWRWIAEPRFYISFCFQTIKRCVDSANRYFAANATLNLLPDRDPIGLITEPQKRQDHHVLKFPEIISTRH